MIKDSFLGRIPAGGTDKRDPILSWLQGRMFRPNGTVRLHCTRGRLRGVEWVHGLFLFPLVLGKSSCPMQNWVFFV